MPDRELSQTEADHLMNIEKIREDNETRDFPESGEQIAVPLLSKDRREHFILDISRGRLKLTKATYQNRVHVAIVLCRLDINGPPHTNPDGGTVPCPHMHIYREGYGFKWAHSLDAISFSEGKNLYETLFQFMDYCKIVKRPIIQKTILS